MKTYLPKRDLIPDSIMDNNQSLNVSYSEREFFYEGQEYSIENDEINADKEKIYTKDKKHNPFQDSFNIFF